MAIVFAGVYGGLLGSMMVERHSGKIKGFYHKTICRKRIFRFSVNENTIEQFGILLVRLSMEAVGSRDSRRIHLGPGTLYLLSQPTCPYRSDFFDDDGNCIRDYIDLPLDDFYIKANLSEVEENQWTWVHVFPISMDRINICGCDFRTDYWFWGAAGLSPDQSYQAMVKTIDRWSTFPFMTKYIRHIRLKYAKIKPIRKDDPESLVQVESFYNRIVDPSYVPLKVNDPAVVKEMILQQQEVQKLIGPANPALKVTTGPKTKPK